MNTYHLKKNILFFFFFWLKVVNKKQWVWRALVVGSSKMAPNSPWVIAFMLLCKLILLSVGWIQWLASKNRMWQVWWNISILSRRDIHFWCSLALSYLDYSHWRKLPCLWRTLWIGPWVILTTWGLSPIVYKKFHSDNNSACRQILQLMKSWNNTAALPTLWQQSHERPWTRGNSLNGIHISGPQIIGGNKWLSFQLLNVGMICYTEIYK